LVIYVKQGIYHNPGHPKLLKVTMILMLMELPKYRYQEEADFRLRSRDI